jgi:hypothetical protein
LQSREIKCNLAAMKIPYRFFTVISGIISLSLLILAGCNLKDNIEAYKGTPLNNDIYKGGAQAIPGKLQCENYDFGGEGVSFHDTDSINSGSGRLNKADGSYLHEFRINEAVDISYTKFQDPPIDNTPYNFVDPEKDQHYVGWTEPGEWIKYTIDVKTEGTYELGLMYTANQNGKISFSINDEDVSGPILVPSTFVAEDSVAWRQWHHWNYIDPIAEIHLKKGIQTFTLHTLEIGAMNYESIDFKLRNK